MGSRQICSHCRQRLHLPAPNTTSTLRCPTCKQTNNIPTSNTGEPNQSANPFILTAGSGGGCTTKMKCKIGRRDKQRPFRSLNYDPSPLGSSGERDARPRKRAFLCGVSYKKWKYKLKGTINDVANMRDFLMTHFGFQETNILVLTEEEQKPELTPTRSNILRALSWLVDDCRHGDSLVFYFSGHGLRQPEFAGDELDGFDETICPVDFLKEGMILDTYINETIVRPLKEGVTLHAIVDACHSGTVLDLEFVYDKATKKWTDNRPPSGAMKGTSGGLAICISACEDDQLAADTSAFDSTMNGALTYMLIDLVKQHHEITYGDLLEKMYKKIEEVNRQGCFGAPKLFKKACWSSLTQKPLLSSSAEFDVFRKQFQL